jgi:hypothetical protein
MKTLEDGASAADRGLMGADHRAVGSEVTRQR